jgi:UDP-N-acetylmuramyl pentapeptide phosphotransferase/UDP-N-acetylglucosamine-1-phosphate transferase
VNTLLIAFCVSLVITFLLIRYQHLHEHISGDHDFLGPQKIHTQSVPRIGGVSIALGLLLGSVYIAFKDHAINPIGFILLACTPVFGIGLAEDLRKNIGVQKRLFFTTIGALLAIFLVPAAITSLDIALLNWLLSFAVISVLFSCFAITGLANAYNIIDGFHGLASMIAIITLGAILYIGFKQNDLLVFKLALCMLAAIAGFFVWNYPRGLIFLGDGGAYLIGFWIAILSIMLVERNSAVSPWFALTINIYPIFETLFTIYRRIIHQNKSPGQPDGIHFHSLIYRRLIRSNTLGQSQSNRNAKTAPYLWILVVTNAIPSIIFFDSTHALQGLTILFILTYWCLYRSIVRFQIPKWFRLY